MFRFKIFVIISHEVTTCYQSRENQSAFTIQWFLSKYYLDTLLNRNTASVLLVLVQQLRKK